MNHYLRRLPILLCVLAVPACHRALRLGHEEHSSAWNGSEIDLATVATDRGRDVRDLPNVPVREVAQVSFDEPEGSPAPSRRSNESLVTFDQPLDSGSPDSAPLPPTPPEELDTPPYAGPSNGGGESSPTLSMALEDAVRVALENSEVVRAIAGNRTIAAATAYDPAIADSHITEAIGVFDTSLSASMFWERRDFPPQLSNQTEFRRRAQLDVADWNLAVRQPLVTGGELSVAWDVDYSFFPPASDPTSTLLNPQYYSPVTFGFRQPLLRGHGEAVTRAPIRIAAARANQTAWEFKRAMLEMVRGVDEAYWSYYAAQQELAAINAVLPPLEEIGRVSQARADAEAAASIDAAQAATQLSDFRRLQLEAMYQVQIQENLLRNVLGLPPSDGRKIRLVNKPFTGRIVADRAVIMGIALDQRPDLMRQRLAIQVKQLEVVLANDAMRWQFDGGGFWRVNGLGHDLIDALDVLGENQFTDWNLGLSLNVPLQQHEAKGRLRGANLDLQRQRALLDQHIHSAAHEINSILLNLDTVYGQYQVALQTQAAAEKWRMGTHARVLEPAGEPTLAVLNSYLQSLRAYTDSARQASILLAQYNIALARLEEAKGTLLETRDVVLELDCCRAAAYAIKQVNDVHSAPGSDSIPLDELPTIGPDGTLDRPFGEEIPAERAKPTAVPDAPLPAPKMPVDLSPPDEKPSRSDSSQAPQNSTEGRASTEDVAEQPAEELEVGEIVPQANAEHPRRASRTPAVRLRTERPAADAESSEHAAVDAPRKRGPVVSGPVARKKDSNSGELVTSPSGQAVVPAGFDESSSGKRASVIPLWKLFAPVK